MTPVTKCSKKKSLKMFRSSVLQSGSLSKSYKCRNIRNHIKLLSNPTKICICIYSTHAHRPLLQYPLGAKCSCLLSCLSRLVTTIFEIENNLFGLHMCSCHASLCTSSFAPFRAIETNCDTQHNECRVLFTAFFLVLT